MNILNRDIKLKTYTGKSKLLIIIAMAALVSSCGVARPPEQSAGHITKEDVVDSSNIPDTLTQSTFLPAPVIRPKLEVYTVIVSDVPVKELLFSMARDAKLNLDIHDDVSGRVTLNAIDQTLPQILERISRHVNIRYEIEESSLRVRADKPYMRTYKIDYVNMSRGSKGLVRVASNIGSTGQGSVGEGSATTSSDGDNSSLTEVNNESVNAFWKTLEKNIHNLLAKDQTEESSAASASSDSLNNVNITINKEAGVIAINGTQKQHKFIQSFVDQVLVNAKRQVLIEVTIAEIKLSDQYQSGVDWSKLASDPTSGVSFTSDLLGANLGASPFSTLTITDTIGGDPSSITLSSLEQFGDVQVLSSPKVMAINNQPAILKVVDNMVYFEMSVDTTSNDTTSTTTYETSIKTVPVGFVMSVTPYISEDNVVTLNIRPTISRIIDSVEDPNPVFKRENIISEIPVIQMREIESILQVNSGDTAIIGGLMEDTVNDTSTGIPILMDIPILGNLFKYKNENRIKSELVIFIKPLVVDQASLSKDLKEYRRYLPIKEVTKKKDVEKTDEKVKG